MKKLVFMLEEPSMEAALTVILPKIVPVSIDWQLIRHEGKRDLELSIPRKLRAWREPYVGFVVVHDQDSEDCRRLKERLVRLCKKSGRPDTLVRIVCHELESWFLGDLNAVSLAFSKPSVASLGNTARYRNPDNLMYAAEEIKKLAPDYQKISGARAIAPLLDFQRNRSLSFHVFVNGVKCLADRFDR